MRESVRNSSNRYSSVLQHISTQSHFLRTNPSYQFLDLNKMHLSIREALSQPHDFSIFNVLKKCYATDALSRDRRQGSIPGSMKREPLPSCRKLGMSLSKETGLQTDRSALSYSSRIIDVQPFTTRSLKRKSKKIATGVILQEKLRDIDTQCRHLKDTLKAERRSSVATKKEVAAQISDVRLSLEAKLAQRCEKGLPASLMARRNSRKPALQPENDYIVSLDEKAGLQEYKKHLWTNAVKGTLTKEMRYVYTLGTCTVVPDAL